MIQVEPEDHDCWAIERSVVSACFCSRVIRGDVVLHLDVNKGVDGDPLMAHGVGPF